MMTDLEKLDYEFAFKEKIVNSVLSSIKYIHDAYGINEDAAEDFIIRCLKEVTAEIG